MPRGGLAAFVGSDEIQTSGEPAQFPLVASFAFAHLTAWKPFLAIASTKNQKALNFNRTIKQI